MAESVEPKACPLTTDQLVDLLLDFIVLFNQPMQIHLYKYQRVFIRRIVRSFLMSDGKCITGLWSRQSGKSCSVYSMVPPVCVLLPTLARAYPDDDRLAPYLGGVKIGVFAPKLEQAGIIYGHIRKHADLASSREIYGDPDINVTVVQSRGDSVAWSNGSFVKAKTASENSNVEGDTYHLVVLDEAQLISKVKVSKEIAPMLAAHNGAMVKIGTANISRGGFYDSIKYNLAQEQITGDQLHFEFAYEQVIAEKREAYKITKLKLHLAYEAWVFEELHRLGGNADNEEFRLNFRLLWQEGNSSAIDYDVLEAAMEVEIEANEGCYNRRLVAGLDYGKKRDATVLTIMAVDPNPVHDSRALVRPGTDQPLFYKKVIIAWYIISGRRWNHILGEVIEALTNYSVDTLVADSTGVGDPLTEQLQDLVPDINIVPMIMSTAGNDLVYKLYLQELEAGRVTYAAGPKTQAMHEYQVFRREHEQLKKERNGVYIKCNAPDGEHDDLPDSAALACYAAALPQRAEVECIGNPFFADAQNRSSASNRSDRYRHPR